MTTSERFVSERIKDVRSSLGMTQQEFADYTGFSYSYISKIESGDKKPGRVFLEKVAQTCGVSVSFLLEGDNIILGSDSKNTQSMVLKEILKRKANNELDLSYKPSLFDDLDYFLKNRGIILYKDIPLDKNDVEYLRSVLQKIIDIKLDQYKLGHKND